MQAENLYQLLSAKLSGEASIDELHALEQYLDQHAEERLHVEAFEKIWKEKNVFVSVDSRAAFSKHINKLKANPSLVADANVVETKAKIVSFKTTLLRISAVAASVILIFLTVYQFEKKTGPGSITDGKAVKVVSTKYGAKKKLLLPDGTQVWLNSGSSITYNAEFSKTSRDITLSGEAFFDVVKDTQHPFIIHTSVMDVKVVGTAFNVRSYPNERTSETSLIRGRVQIILHQNPGKDLFLNPNDKIIIQNLAADTDKQNNLKGLEPKVLFTQMHQLKQDSTTMETSWMANKIAFDNETLEQIALKLERWFDVKVSIQDESLKTVTYYGVFEDENLGEVLTALQLTGNFHFKMINEKEVVIMP